MKETDIIIVEESRIKKEPWKKNFVPPTKNILKEEKVKIYLNDKDGKRKIVEVELIEDRKLSVKVKLPDGNIIIRKKNRDIVKEEE